MRLLFSLLLCLALPALATAADPVLYRPLQLDTGSGVLKGSLILPRSDRPQPVVLFVSGSGPIDRNGNAPGARNAALQRLAEALGRQRIASVRFDKRGVAESRSAEPDESRLSVERYVDDLVGWIRLLRADPRFSAVILLGHSEGALIASLAADRVPVAGVVTLAGSGRPIDVVLREQLAGKLSPAGLASAQWIIDQLLRGTPVPEVPKELLVLFRPSVQPYLISLFRQDPARAFAGIHAPALIVQGTHDIQVEVDDARALQRAKPEAELAIIAGMNHMLRSTPADFQAQLPSYDNPNLPLARALVERVTAFVARSGSSRAGR